MKMKSIFLSMLAIAALASCTQENFNVDPPGTQPQEGEKMVVNLTLSTGEITKASGVPGADDEKTITDITVFFLNSADQIVSRTFVTGTDNILNDTESGNKKITVETRTTASQVMVITNIGEDRTTTGGALNVSNKAQLQAVIQDLVIPTSDSNTALKPFQTNTNLLMSGTGNVVGMAPNPDAPTEPHTATATVDLKYIAAKITLKSITVTTDAQGIYGEGKDFVFTKAYLLNAQTKSHYFPAYLPATDDLKFVNGTWEEEWGTSPLETVADFSQTLSIPTITKGAAVENQAHWYVFENNPASTAKTDNPTILAVQVKWLEEKKGDIVNGTEIGSDKYVNKNFNVIFAPGDKGVIEAGKAYDVSLSFSGDFRPGSSGGNAGGGEDKPDEPNIKANVTVSVKPAEWAPITTDKPFK